MRPDERKVRDVLETTAEYLRDEIDTEFAHGLATQLEALLDPAPTDGSGGRYAIELIEAADRIDHLDHELNDGRPVLGHPGKVVMGGTAIQDECQRIREIARSLPDTETTEGLVRVELTREEAIIIDRQIPSGHSSLEHSDKLYKSIHAKLRAALTDEDKATEGAKVREAWSHLRAALGDEGETGDE